MILSTAGLVVAGVGSAAGGATTPTTVRVSVSSAGVQANAGVRLRGISDDGRYVLMDSAASNLVAGDTNGVRDVFVRDTLRKQTVRVSVSFSGRQANGPSVANAISGNGRFVVFTSTASNLSVAKDTNHAWDAFIRDRQLGITRRVSIPPSGGQFRWGVGDGAKMVSADGRYVVFNQYVRDRERKTTTRLVNPAGAWVATAGGLSPDGQMVAFMWFHTLDSWSRLTILDRRTGRSVLAMDDVWSGSVSFTDDGSEAVFERDGGPTVTIWRIDGTTTDVVQGRSPTFTADGAMVSVISWSAKLVSGDTNHTKDLFVRDLATGTTARLDLTATGAQITKGANGGAISADGHWAAFSTKGGQVVAGDTNKTTDVFLVGPLTATSLGR